MSPWWSRSAKCTAATTTVTRTDGDLRVQDGPFAETKEIWAVRAAKQDEAGRLELLWQCAVVAP